MKNSVNLATFEKRKFQDFKVGDVCCLVNENNIYKPYLFKCIIKDEDVSFIAQLLTYDNVLENCDLNKNYYQDKEFWVLKRD